MLMCEVDAAILGIEVDAGPLLETAPCLNRLKIELRPQPVVRN